MSLGNSFWGLSGGSGGGGGGTISGGGTQKYIPKFYPDGITIADSQLFDDGNGIGLGTITINPSAKLEIVSTTQGVLLPRMTTIQRDAISSPSTSLLIYNTATSLFEYYDGAGWRTVLSTNTVTTEVVVADTTITININGNNFKFLARAV